MGYSKTRWLSAVGLCALLAVASGATADVIIRGRTNVDPNGHQFYIGYGGDASVQITAGSTYSDSEGFIGYSPGYTGTVMVTGAGSTWTNTYDLYVGYGGTGQLTVSDGGVVTVPTFYGSFSNLFGNGTINVQGAVLDSDLYFDSGHGLTQAFTFGFGGAFNLNLSASSSLGAGYNGTGSLHISDGVTVTSLGGYVGFNAGSSGTATVSGPGSRWVMTGLTVGRSGNGTLNILGGAQVNIAGGVIGSNAGSFGTVNVSGQGSAWTSTSLIVVGDSDRAKLNVIDGGIVTTPTLYGSLASLSGDGTIKATNEILDGDVVFDGAHQTASGMAVPFGSGGTLYLNPNSSSTLGAGYRGTGALRIADGVTVQSEYGYLGYDPGSFGAGTISGSGSNWILSGALEVGHLGNGSFNIQDGGQVNCAGASIGSFSTGLVSTATVSGIGSKWNCNGDFSVGPSGTGSLVIESGGAVNATGDAYISAASNSTGTAMVSGTGSTWSISGLFHVGAPGYNYDGNLSGTLNILAGGQVSSSSAQIGGPNPTCIGSVTVSGSGSAWKSAGEIDVENGTINVTNGGLVATQTLNSPMSSLLGNGTITANGAITDANLVFDTTHGASQAISFGLGGVLNLMLDGTGTLGCRDGGFIRITDGITVASAEGSVNHGTATVSGSGATWMIADELTGTGNLNVQGGGQLIDDTATCSGAWTVAGGGSRWTNGDSLDVMNGNLNIEYGGLLSNTDGYLRSGSATVTGAGSKWISSNGLSVYNATLTVSDFGQVIAPGVLVNGTLRLHVSGNNMIVLGDSDAAGMISNYGSVKLYADAFLPPGVYTPIADCAGRSVTWNGWGLYDTTGGRWDSAPHVFTVAAATAVAAGASVPVSNGQRLLITDANSGKTLGVSFGGVSANTNFSAWVSSSSEIAALAATPGVNGSIIEAWDFQTNNLTLGLLSFDVGQQPSLSVWTLYHGQWGSFVPDLFTYDSNGVVSFTVPWYPINGYAVVAIPEPATGSLFAFGVALLARRRRS